MIETYWEVKKKVDHNKEGFPLEQEIHPVIREILHQKGITKEKDKKEYLSSKPTRTHDPFLMKGMQEAVEKIKDSMEKKQRILIYGDYDVDGVTSTSLLVDFLGEIYPLVSYFVPDRMEEGYGLHKGALEKLLEEEGFHLLITVDCGISGNEEIAFLKEKGVEAIVTDHHTPGEVLPPAIIVNPKQKDCPYPYKDLSGCGIAFKLTQGLQRSMGLDKKLLNRNLDLVALATVADVVPLQEENRTLLKYGLRKLNQGGRVGLDRLIKKIGLEDKRITPGHIGFMIGPHLNAGGRVAHGKKGVELLLTRDEKKAEKIAEHLIRCNKERQTIQEEGLKRCLDEINEYYKEDLFLVVDLPDLHEGVIGIIAGRIKELYHRPVLVLTNSEEEKVYKGSGRSIDGIDLYQEMMKNQELFLKFGGHPKACGMSILKEHIETLRKRLNLRAREMGKEDPKLFKKRVLISKVLEEEELTEDFIEALSLLEPFGMGNEKPSFALENVEVLKEGTKKMGKEKNHLCLMGKVKGGKTMKAIGFHRGESYFENLKAPSRVNIAFFPEINEWQGRRSIQLLIEDLKESQTD